MGTGFFCGVSLFREILPEKRILILENPGKLWGEISSTRNSPDSFRLAPGLLFVCIWDPDGEGKTEI